MRVTAYTTMDSGGDGSYNVLYFPTAKARDEYQAKLETSKYYEGPCDGERDDEYTIEDGVLKPVFGFAELKDLDWMFKS